MARDPIINPAASSKGSPRNTSIMGGRVTSTNHGGPNFSAKHDLKSGFPPPKAAGK